MGQTVYLVRHAAAESAHPHGDASRALTAAGRTGFTTRVNAVRGQLEVKRIVCSPFVRAVQTAESLGSVLGVAVTTEESLSSGHLSGPGIISLASQLGSGVVLVGHNPEMAEAIS